MYFLCIGDPLIATTLVVIGMIDVNQGRNLEQASQKIVLYFKVKLSFTGPPEMKSDNMMYDVPPPVQKSMLGANVVDNTTLFSILCNCPTKRSPVLIRSIFQSRLVCQSIADFVEARPFVTLLMIIGVKTCDCKSALRNVRFTSFGLSQMPYRV